MISSRATRDESIDALFALLEPPVEESVCDFVTENVKIPTGAVTGDFQLDRIPYGREILERFNDKTARHLVMVSGTQAAKSTILICGMLFKIAKQPEDAMWIFGNADQARDFNKERFMAYCEQCPPVAAKLPRTRTGIVDKNLWGFINQHYIDMVLNFVGAGSRTNLSSRPRGLIVMDETDKYHEELKFDAGTIQLAEERQKSFPFPLSVKASSPSEEGRMIWAEYVKTDMRRYWLPCPRCEKEILLKFKFDSEQHGECGIRWWHEDPEEAKTDGEWDLRKVIANAFYKCQCCGGTIHNFERYDMLQNGIWKPSNPRAEPGRYGYHVNSIYSIIGNETSLGMIASKFLMAKKSRSELKNFVNGWLAEPWDEFMAYDTPEKRIKLEIFDERKIPKDEAESIMTIDYQMNGFWVLVRKFAPPTEQRPNGESWLVYADWVQTEDEWMEKKDYFSVADNDACMDMAKRPGQASKIIVRNNIRGMWGSPATKEFWHPDPNDDRRRISRPYSVVHSRDPMLGTKWENRTIARAIYVNFSKSAALDAVDALRYANPTIWHASVNVHEKYQRHLSAFQKRQMQNKRTGRIEWEWGNIHNDDHLYDCECMAVIRAQQKGLVILPDDPILATR